MAFPQGFSASEMTLLIEATNAAAESNKGGDDLSGLTDTERGYSVTAVEFPDFRFNTEERNAGGYLLPVDTLLPVQELTFSVNVFDETLFRAVMRPYGGLGALTNGVLGGPDDQPQLTFYTTIKRQSDARRRALRLTYEGRIADARQSGYTPDGAQTFDVVVNPVFKYKREVSNWVHADAALAESAFETLQDINLVDGQYIVNGFDIWAARKATLGLK